MGSIFASHKKKKKKKKGFLRNLSLRIGGKLGKANSAKINSANLSSRKDSISLKVGLR